MNVAGPGRGGLGAGLIHRAFRVDGTSTSGARGSEDKRPPVPTVAWKTAALGRGTARTSPTLETQLQEVLVCGQRQHDIPKGFQAINPCQETLEKRT